MRSFKLAVTFLSAGLMAYSPVTWASMNLEQKAVFNRSLKQGTSGTYNDLYNRSAHTLTPASQGLMEAWLKNFGQQKLPQPQAQIIKDKNGKEQVKVILNQGGKTVTMTFSPENKNSVNINGVNLHISEARDLTVVLAKLASKDSSLRPLARAITNNPPTVSKKWQGLTAKQIMKLKPLQRVQYFSHLRESVEAAQKVLDLQQKPQKKTSYLLHPLIAADLAWAAETAKSLQGQSCMVSGNLSVYEGGKCEPFPGSPNQHHPPAQHSQCEGFSGKNRVACNPLFYGYQDNGRPFCQDPNRSNFTNTATAECNRMSGLDGTEGSPERIKAYGRILKSYAATKHGKDKVAECFQAETGKVNAGMKACTDMVKEHLTAFENFKVQAAVVCANFFEKNIKMPDQEIACRNFEERDLKIYDYLSEISSKEIASGKVTGVDAQAEKCSEAGGRWQDGDCICTTTHNAYSATKNFDYSYSCDRDLTDQVVGAEKEKDKCTKEDGSKSHSISCNPLLWIAGIALLWLFVRSWRDGDTKTPPVPTTTLPGGGVVPTTTLPAEGGAGSNDGASGGIRPGSK